MTTQTYMTNDDQERAIEGLIAEPTVVSVNVVVYNVNYHELVVVTLHHKDNSETTVSLDHDGSPL